MKNQKYELFCSKQDHNNEKIKSICIDPNCRRSEACCNKCEEIHNHVKSQYKRVKDLTPETFPQISKQQELVKENTETILQRVKGLRTIFESINYLENFFQSPNIQNLENVAKQIKFGKQEDQMGPLKNKFEEILQIFKDIENIIKSQGFEYSNINNFQYQTLSQTRFQGNQNEIREIHQPRYPNRDRGNTAQFFSRDLNSNQSKQSNDIDAQSFSFTGTCYQNQFRNAGQQIFQTSQHFLNFDRLTSGTSYENVVVSSNSKKYILQFGSDGVLLFINQTNNNKSIIAKPKLSNKAPYHLIFRYDGAMELQDKTGACYHWETMVFNSFTKYQQPLHLVISDSGELEMIDNTNIIIMSRRFS